MTWVRTSGLLAVLTRLAGARRAGTRSLKTVSNLRARSALASVHMQLNAG